MKKKVLTAVIFLLIAVSCFASENPRWSSMPLHVYLPQCGHVTTLMQQAFSAWEKASKSLVRFTYVRTPSNAEIVVEFVDFVACKNSDSANGVVVGCTEMNTRGNRYSKAYITIGTKEYSRKYDISGFKRDIIDRTDEHIYGAMLHEIGHSIGLSHSEDNQSVMYPYDLNLMQYVTKKDIQMLYNKYQ